MFSEGSFSSASSGLAVAVGVTQPELLAQLLFVARRLGDGLLFQRAERRDAVIEVRNQHMTVRVLHAGEQLRQHHRRIGRPVAVVAAVQFAVRPVERDGEMRHAARAEDHALASALVNRAIADEPDVSAEFAAILLEHGAEVCRTRFLFAFPDETQIGLERNVRGLQCVERGKLREDGGLVVGRGARVDARLAIDHFRHRRKGRFGFPFLGSDGLTVVVRVEDDGVLRAGRLDLAIDHRIGSGRGEQLSFNVAALEHPDQRFGVALDVRFVAGDVGDGEETGELLQDLLLVRSPPLTRSVSGSLREEECCRKENRGQSCNS